MRRALYGALDAALRTDDGLAIVRRVLGDVGPTGPLGVPPSAVKAGTPYADLGRAQTDRGLARPPIFVTARFRSGSTLLWNLFRHVDGCTAYYEPLNERRWFDRAARGAHTDATHKHVDDYWKEYGGLEVLGHFYREAWIRRRLYMDATAWDPDLRQYIHTLIERAPGRAVLQFNRVDFRLPWLRHTFPEATIIHLYRHPRDQWCSSLVDPAACPPACDMRSFAACDHYYLLSWANDLRHQFPFLEPATVGHPYRLFYLMWKLSYVFGVTYAHYSVRYESLVANSELEMQRLFKFVGIDPRDLRRLTGLIEPTPSRWQRYASHEWFKDHESACESILADFFGRSSLPLPTTLDNTSARAANQ